MLLDAHSLIYRAYFALLETPLTTSRGQLVNAAFGFWSIVLRGLPGREAGLRHRLLRRRPDVPPRPVRRIQGHAAPDARRPARPVPDHPRAAGRLPDSRAPARGLRGRRPHRVADAPGGGARRRVDDRLGRPGHAPAGQRQDPADDHAHGRRVDGDLRRRAHPRALRPRALPDDRLQGAQGRHHGQHPGHRRRRRQDRCRLAPAVRHARRHLRAPRRDQAGALPREAARAPRRRLPVARAGDHRPQHPHRARPDARSPGRLRPQRGPAALPRVRVPHPGGAAPRGRRRGGPGAGRPAARGRPERPGPGGPRSGTRAIGAQPTAVRLRRGERPPAEPRLRAVASGRGRPRGEAPGTVAGAAPKGSAGRSRHGIGPAARDRGRSGRPGSARPAGARAARPGRISRAVRGRRRHRGAGWPASRT